MELLPAFWWAAMDKNGTGKSRPHRHCILYKPAVYHFGWKKQEWKKKEKMAVTGTETGEAFSRPFHGYRILYGNSHRFFPVFRPSPESPSVSLPAPRAPSRPKPIRLKTHHSPLQCLNPSSVAPRPQPSRASRRRPGSVNRTVGNRSGLTGYRSNRSGPVPVRSGMKPVKIQNLNLNSKK